MQITYHNHATVYHASLAFLSQRRSLASKKIPCFCHQSSLTIPLHSSWILCFTPRIALGPAKNETAAWTVTILDDLQIPPENQIPLVLENWNLSQGLLKKEVVSSKDVQQISITHVRGLHICHQSMSGLWKAVLGALSPVWGGLSASGALWRTLGPRLRARPSMATSEVRPQAERRGCLSGLSRLAG